MLDLTANNNDGTHSGTPSYVTAAYVSRNLVIDPGSENGGIGGWTVGDAATTISKSTTEIFKDAQSLKVLNGDGTQAFARQTITTVTGADYRFSGRFFAPTTPNGASQLVDVDLAAALGVTVTQAGLSAGWNDVEFCFEAADTSTTIDLGSGSVTNTEFGYWDDVRVESNLIVNGGMEGVYDDESGGGGGTVDVAPGWNKQGVETDGTDELSKETTIVHSGSASQKIDVDANGEGIVQGLNLVVGQYYTLSTWIYIASGEATLRLFSVAESFITPAITTTGAWLKVSLSFQSPNSGVQIMIRSSGGAATYYVDDVTLTRLDIAAASTADRNRSFADGKIESVALWDRAMGFEEVQERKGEI